jgi:hypothetical protein
MFDTIGSVIGQAREGNVKALGVTSQAIFLRSRVSRCRHAPGFRCVRFYGVGVRTGTARGRLRYDRARYASDLSSAGVGDRLATFAAETIISDAAGFATLLANEREKWGKLISELKIRTD